MKAVLLSDFLYHNIDSQLEGHTWVYDIILPLIKQVSDVEVFSLKSLCDGQGKSFSRDKFFELSNIYNISRRYFNYNVNKITKDSVDYLKSFISSDTLVLGFELGLDLRNILNSLGITFINGWFHSFKLLDDMPLLLNTNSKEIFEKINQYKIPKEKFQFYANYYKIYIERNKLLHDNLIEENSAIFIGQTLNDISVFDGTKFLNISDCKEILENVSKDYSAIYYLMHPNVENKDIILGYLKDMPYIRLIESIPTYAILTSSKVKKVFAISSSVVYEASFFNKDSEYLYKPLFDIDSSFDINTFISIDEVFFTSKFWSEILSPISDTKYVEKFVNYFTDMKNKLRRVNNLYWGYSIFDEGKVLSNKISSFEASYTSKHNNQSANYFKLYSDLESRILKLEGGVSTPMVAHCARDFSFASGERQTGKTLNEIRKDHTLRYAKCVQIINEFFGSNAIDVLDIFAGSGYGSSIISNNTNGTVFAIEGSKEAVDFANNYYANDKIFFSNKLFPFKLSKNKYNVVCSLESIEHIEDDCLFLEEIISSLMPNGLLFLSVPNSAMNDLAKNPNKFHFRHYSFSDVMEKIDGRLELLTYYGQDTYLMDGGVVKGTLINEDEFELRENIEGQFILFVFQKK